MKPFMKSYFRLAAIASLATVLAACGSNPSQPEIADTAEPVLDENGKRVATPNPYFAERTSVPTGAQQAMSRAREFFDQQQFQAAETELQQVVAQWPNLSGAWLNLSKVQLKLAQPEQAEASLRRAVEANAKNVFAWNALGVLLRDQGRFEDARVAYESALAQWPDFAMGHRNLGILYDLYLHKPEQALHHYREAKALEEAEDRVLAGWIVDLERRM
ncbi:tetratricopeptide repeat protein [Microbulbifer harenosus]|uniref:Tetratricopeptide repeat protein n=1 Tax=Microbulbifer harenosus TaxID=2576840 RepID=A0ABY2UL23_9GAMM|nr:tetratricopeptide repeat protein [Microbulbifer harenosus]TLM79138.1 tetratricopeptide repeat protein [Microbulbifer harenosus]